MTIPEHIMIGVSVLVRQKGQSIFTRQQIYEELEVDSHQWQFSYNPIFQGMRDDQPGDALDVAEQYKRVFHRVGYGQYRLSDYGQTVF